LKADEVNSLLDEVIRKHHEAFVVEMVGPQASGLPDEEIKTLIKEGFLTKDASTGVPVRGSRQELDPFTFSREMGRSMENADPARRAALRQMPLSGWVKIVEKGAETIRDVVHEHSTEHLSLPEPPRPAASVATTRPVRAIEPTPGLSRQEQEAYVQAMDRAGSYIRGLGNRISQNTGSLVREVWDKEQIVLEVDPALRQETVDIVRDKVADAFRQRQSVQKLVSELGHATKDWARNWERIARTELQGSYNEGVILDAIRVYGDTAGMARVPETSACRHCLRLFLDEEGRPRVFSIQELLSNGTNVGKKPMQWVATVWPAHPNCRCDTVTVPPGMKIGKDGILLLEGEEDED
jgi:hypothetical protein